MLGLEHWKYLLEGQCFSVFSTIQEITLPVKKLRDYTLAILPAASQPTCTLHNVLHAFSHLLSGIQPNSPTGQL